MINLLLFVLLIGFGIILFKLNVLGRKWGSNLESFVLKVLLPLFIVENIISKKINLDVHEQKFICAYLIGSVIAFCLSLAINRQSTTVEQIMRGYSSINVNTVFFSIPMVGFYLHNPSSALIINLLQPFLYLPLLIVSLNYFQHQKYKKHSFNHLSLAILISIAFGVFIRTLNVSIPQMVFSSLEYIGDMIFYIAPICFGANIASLSQFKIPGYYPTLMMKTIVFPVICCLIGHYIFHLDRYWMISLFIISASPLGLFSVFVANEYSISPKQFNVLLIFSSIASLVLVNLVLVVLHFFT